MRTIVPLLVAALLAAAPAAVAAGAEIEFLSGNKLECTVLSKDDKQVKVRMTVDGQPVERTFLLSAIHAVTINDKRYVINEKRSARPATSISATPAGDGAPRRTKAEIEALIDKVGREPPEWFASTTLNLPPSLDLSWPEKPEGSWNNQKNVGQYVWDIINPNPGKWREGVKLMHELLQRHKDDPQKRQRAMIELGRMYFNLHADYPRAAFWWRAAGVDKPNAKQHGCRIGLAECYWRLGNKQMALDLIDPRKKWPVTIDTCKLLADMGDMRTAVQLAEMYGKQTNARVEELYVNIADGFRQQGNAKEAKAWYERVLALQPNQATNAERMQNAQQRARGAIEAIELLARTDPAKIADGNYKASSLGYEGQVEVTVTVKSGRIENVRVTNHKEKQFYSALTDTPAKILAKQGVKGVDATSKATITSHAIINATAKALASGASN